MTSDQVETLENKFKIIWPLLDERSSRIWAATEAQALPRGGISTVASITGLSRTTIHAGINECTKPSKLQSARVRRQGGGRKTIIQHNPRLLHSLKILLESTTRGDPQSPLRWTCKSTRRLAEELERQDFTISERTIAGLLHEMNYSLQANVKTKEGTSHPDRDAQFRYINEQTKLYQKRGAPVISVDTKKKELVGNYKNNGVEWHLEGKAQKVRVHDFIDKKLGKAIPYGVYDISRNEGWVSVGIDHDTSEFAADAILGWWRTMGKKRYLKAEELLIMADNGGSNGARSGFWKVAVQKLADRTGLVIRICHFPPGTSKWNKIEHRMFSFITQNWRGRPLVSHEVIVNLIGSTTTEAGLKIKAELNTRQYETGKKIDEEKLAEVQIRPQRFHGDWNYDILPRKQNTRT